ncbi:hypothetical protein [Prochlorococcus sp. MIT 1341]|uniref:hypothetical protein n=1 Tax=Prochlorococcus sp. MIT 1341 TaxID=3096221 RepID=UPI002A762620|nr:hypothetical protein [Prochlorococcus sp. MIT 1341]
MGKKNPNKDSPLKRREVLERIYLIDCDIDPLIMRARLQRHRGEERYAIAIELEITPIV